jgi:hypothetical protein
VRIDAASELTHLVEMLIEHAMQSSSVDAEITVHECVSKAGKRPELDG